MGRKGESGTERARSRLAFVNVATPIAAVLVLLATWGRSLPGAVAVAVALVLATAVLASVHHAEVVADRVGEPFGSIVLAIAVTLIEVGLIITLMVSGGPETDSLARDTVFAAVMITMNGIAGLSLLIGATRRGLAQFNSEGSGAAVSTIATLATVCLVLPNFTTSAHGPMYSPSQLVFAGVTSVALYVLFVLTQTGRHREFFVHPEQMTTATEPTSRRGAAMSSLILLVLALTAVVGLAKVEAPSIEAAVTSAGMPEAFVGVVIAMVVLLPETLAAIRSALNDRIQISLNLAYGSAMASIGLTIPAVALATIWLDRSLVLGLGTTQIALLVLTVVVSTLTVVPGRATRLQGCIHIVLAAVFVFLAINP